MLTKTVGLHLSGLHKDSHTLSKDLVEFDWFTGTARGFEIL